MELILLWLIFGIISGIIADKKNRNVVGWGILGIVIGIFAIIIIAVLPALPKETKV